MLPYAPYLKHKARQLRKNMTDSERVLWSRIRRRQILDIQFYSQRPIGPYIVDFYSPTAKLVIEVDGSQHMEPWQAEQDRERDMYLESCGLKVLRFNNRQVLKETDSVVEVIYLTLEGILALE